VSALSCAGADVRKLWSILYQEREEFEDLDIMNIEADDAAMG
jgi:hypothetical protein